jgi:hypothetical protein
VDAELKLTLAIVCGEPLEDKGTETRTRPATEGVEDKEALKPAGRCQEKGWRWGAMGWDSARAASDAQKRESATAELKKTHLYAEARALMACRGWGVDDTRNPGR